MKPNGITNALRWIAIFSLLALVLQWNGSAQTMSVVDRIKSEPAFLEPIRWVGEVPPTEAESVVLWNVLSVMREEGTGIGIPLLDQFTQDFPNSAWTPSVRANLAWHYRRRGAYTRALEHWETAWLAVKNDVSKDGNYVRSFTLGRWVGLLTRLGRVERLKELYIENGEHPLDGGAFYSLYERSIGAVQRMVRDPGTTFRCGSLALANVAEQLGLAPDKIRELRRLPSPDTGFSLSQLVELAAENEVALVPVRRTRATELVVPSVVHWKTDHYAAIIGIDGDYCQVLDPTFGHPRWLRTAYVNEEASGHFLVPASKVIGSSFLSVLNRDVTDQVFGRGYPDDFADDDDGDCPSDDPDNEEVDASSPSAQSDPNDTECAECPDGGGSASTEPCEESGGCDGCGMAVWAVSQPHITLWVTDTPVYYTKSDGKVQKFTLSYKHRSCATTGSSGGFGELWEASFLNYIIVDDGANGGITNPHRGAIRTYSLTQPEFYTMRETDYSTTGGIGDGTDSYTVKTVKQAKLLFGYQQSFTSDVSRYYVSTQTDRFGSNTYYVYSILNDVVKLTSMTDSDGLVTTFKYGTGVNADKITEINAPYNRTATFTYDLNERLASITDAEGMISSFTYDSNGFMTVMTTPYGDTEFEDAADLAVTNTTYVPTRAIFVTHPNASEELFMYRNASQKLNPTLQYILMDWGIPDNTFDVPDIPGYSDSFDYDYADSRNSFHWGPQHYAALNGTFKTSRDFYDLSRGDYTLAHVKHWLKTPNDGTGGLAPILGIEFYPNPDGAVTPPATNISIQLGKSIWYDYHDQPYTYGVGDYPFARHVATVLSNDEVQFTRYERNSDGQMAKEIESYTNESGTLTTREFKYTYNANGLKTKKEYYNGSAYVTLEEWTYDDTNNPNKVTDYKNPAGEWTYYTYDSGTGKITERELPSGLVTTYSYTGRWLTSITDKDESLSTMRTRSFTYEDGQVKTYTDPLGLTRTFNFDDLDRLEQVTYPDSSDKQYTYNKLDRSSAKDRMGFWTYYYYDSIRRLTKITNPLLKDTEFEYCDCEALSQIKYHTGDTVDFEYDFNGNLLTVIKDSGDEINNVYHVDGRLKSRDDGQATYNFGYNNQGIHNTLSNSVPTQIAKVDYDRLDRPVKVTRANKGVVNQTFDDAGRLLTRSQVDGGLETLEWGNRGLESRKFKETASLTHTNTFGYDELYRRTAMTNANNEVLSYTYNAAGQLLTLTDGAQQTTTWVYDTEGNVTNKKDDDNTTILTYWWDDNGRMTSRWSLEKGTTDYTYDNNGNLTEIDYVVGATDITYSYDDLDRLSSMTDDSGTTGFTYNGDGRLATEDGPWASDTLTYTYTDRYRTKASLQQPTGTWDIDYTYDADGRMDTVVSDSGTFDYDYVGASRDVEDLTLPSSRFIDYDYDTVGRLDETILKMSSGGAVIKKHSYAYNLASWKTDHTIYTGGTTDRDFDFDYDNIGQLEFADDSNTTLDDFEYVYDDAWNLDERFIDETSENFTVDNLNQLTSHTAVYDDNGNLESQGTGTTLETYTYNAENQLASLRYYTSTYWERQVDYTYDGLGRLRVRKTTVYRLGTPYTSWEYRYVYDGRTVIQERNSNNTVRASYTRGLDLSGTLQGAGGIGGLLARNWGSNHAFYHSDAMGNVTTLIDSSGTVKASYAYDPYGFTISQSGSWASANPYRFSSKEQEINGIYYYGFRFYDPNLQRWLNRDPIGERGGINLYGFVHNTPTGLVDVDGRWVFLPALPAILEAIGIGAAVGACEAGAVGGGLALGAGWGWAVGGPSAGIAMPAMGGSIVNAPPKVPFVFEAKNRDEEIKRGPKGGVAHDPGKGHDTKTGPQKKRRFQEKARKKKAKEQNDLTDAWDVWNNLPDPAKKLREDLRPPNPDPRCQ